MIDRRTFVGAVAGALLASPLGIEAQQVDGVDAGGLISYGARLSDMFRHAATHVDQILSGGKPGDIPVEQPTKFELVVNLKTAQALGLTIPKSLLAARG